MSAANDLRASAAHWPQDWPPQEHTLWEITRAFTSPYNDEYLGELAGELPWFLLLVAAALDDCTASVMAVQEYRCNVLFRDGSRLHGLTEAEVKQHEGHIARVWRVPVWPAPSGVDSGDGRRG